MRTEGFPDYVHIGPHEFEIVWNTQALTKLARAGAGDRFGQSEMDTMTITVSPDRAFSGIQETLVHEIIHCLIWEAGIDIPENPEASAYDREEKFVGQFSGILLDTLQRNPHIVKFLQREDV